MKIRILEIGVIFSRGEKHFFDSVLARVAPIAVWLPAADTAVTLLSLWSQTVLTFADYCHCHVNVQ